MRKKKSLTGLAAQYAAGKKVVTLPLAAADHELIKSAAEKDGRSVTAFVRHHAIEAARRLTSQ